MTDQTCLITWSDALSVGNPAIDIEHRHFAELVNRLNIAIISRQDKAEIVRIMQLIQDDARLHFAHEEDLFAEHGFPLAEEHTRIHRLLTENLRQAMQELQQAEFEKEWVELGLNVKAQLVSHLLNIDRQYIEYLAEPGRT